jgi:hypothetical protein
VLGGGGSGEYAENAQANAGTVNNSWTAVPRGPALDAPESIFSKSKLAGTTS